MHHLFIHSFVDGHLGWFHVLAIVNRAAVNTGSNRLWIERIFPFLASCLVCKQSSAFPDGFSSFPNNPSLLSFWVALWGHPCCVPWLHVTTYLRHWNCGKLEGRRVWSTFVWQLLHPITDNGWTVWREGVQIVGDRKWLTLALRSLWFARWTVLGN